MITMVLSVSAVLANSFAGQLLSDEKISTEFAVEGEADSGIKDRQTESASRSYQRGNIIY
jgi:hypothetical protein